MTGLSHLSRFKIPSHITNCPGQFFYVKKKQRYFNCSFERESNGQNSLTWKILFSLIFARGMATLYYRLIRVSENLSLGGDSGRIVMSKK